MASEFDLIARYFTRPTTHTAVGIGDDGAVLGLAPGMQLVVSTDMLVAGTHFLPETEPESLGWKTLAVNVSDLAAMGAAPRWAVLALALPSADETWIEGFCQGLFACAEAHGVDLVGGDTTRGPLNLCPTLFGEVPSGQALLRSGAQQGDQIWVSGSPGLAALGLAQLQGRTQLQEPALTDCLSALHRPQARVALGLALRGLASAAIDVSDGLLGDLGHILEASSVGAELHLELMPKAAELACADLPLARHCLLCGGDDYELLFTAPPEREAEILAISSRLGLPLTKIGAIVPPEAEKLRLCLAGKTVALGCYNSYDHFAVTP